MTYVCMTYVSMFIYNFTIFSSFYDCLFLYIFVCCLLFFFFLGTCNNNLVSVDGLRC